MDIEWKEGMVCALVSGRDIIQLGEVDSVEFNGGACILANGIVYDSEVWDLVTRSETEDVGVKHDQYKPKSSIDYLNECASVQAQRGEQYDKGGTGERSFAAAANAFAALTGKELTGSDICLILACVKAVRQYSNPERLHEDSLLDGVSYLSLWAEELNKELLMEQNK